MQGTIDGDHALISFFFSFCEYSLFFLQENCPPTGLRWCGGVPYPQYKVWRAKWMVFISFFSPNIVFFLKENRRWTGSWQHGNILYPQFEVQRARLTVIVTFFFTLPFLNTNTFFFFYRKTALNQAHDDMAVSPPPKNLTPYVSIRIPPPPFFFY